MLNAVCLMGRMVADPELRHTQSQIPVTSFRIAVDRTYQPKGAEQRQADFLDIVAWRNTAEFVCRYFRKGQLIAVQGSIQTRKYTDKDGNNRFPRSPRNRQLPSPPPMREILRRLPMILICFRFKEGTVWGKPAETKERPGSVR